MQPAEVYDHRAKTFRRIHARRKRLAERLSNVRLAVMIIGGVGTYMLYRSSAPAVAFVTALLTLLLYTLIVNRHRRVLRHVRYLQVLQSINARGAARVAGRWNEFKDAGADFIDDDHPFASDLDLFGTGSLFQWINSCTTPRGRVRLAQILKAKAPERAEIVARQEAVRELANKLPWRQRFEAAGLVEPRLEPQHDEGTEALVHWARTPQQLYLHPAVRVGIRLLPAVTLSVMILSAFLPALTWRFPTFLVGVQTALLFIGGKTRLQELLAVHDQVARLRSYVRMLKVFEKEKFKSEWLTRRQDRLRDDSGHTAYEQAERLSKIADRIASRENALFVPLNILLLWDHQCMVALSVWKHQAGRRLPTWLDTLAETEALSSLANIRFEHQDWAFPVIDEETTVNGERFGLMAKRLGHPLIRHDRVCNDFHLTPSSPMALITGSNMAGKSTFLRSVGINLVLAYAGAPVCAESFHCSRLTLWTSMRTADSLEQGVSSFYAEILRIKRIVDAARRDRPILCLLDEIFKGTNSHDRHEGAKALITSLLTEGAYGLVATHDLELAVLERDTRGKVRNYHFREHFREGEISFDYTLRNGVSTTRNALHLIKMMGITSSSST